MNRIFQTLICSLFLVTGLSGQNNNYWVKAKGPSGGDLEVTKTNSGILYGLRNPNGAFWYWYRSADNGNTWSPLPITFNNLPYDWRMSIGPGGNFYITWIDDNGNPNLYKSENEGNDWQLVNDTLPPIFVDEMNTGTLIGRSDTAIWRSTDNGASWEQVFVTPDLYLNAYAPIQNLANGDLLITTLNSNGPAYRSSDDGQNWQSVQKPDNAARELFVSSTGTLFWLRVSGGSGIFRSDDNGVTWTDIPLSNLPNKYIYSMLELPTGRLLGANSYNEKLLYSDDDGITWQVLPCDFDIASLKATPILADGAIFGRSKNSLYRSGDGGLTWQFSAYGLDFSLVEQLEFVTADTFYAETLDGVWRTFDKGETWSKLTENKRHFDYDEIYRKPMAVSGHKLLIIADSTALWSGDRGETFNNVTPPNGLYNRFAKCSPDGSILFLNGKSGMCRSIDNGENWTTVTANRFFSEIAFHPSGRLYGILKYPWSGPALWYSDDDGANWQQLNPNGLSSSIRAVFINHPGQIFIDEFSGIHRLFRSDNNGASWSNVSYPDFDIGGDAVFIENAEGHIIAFNYQSDKICRSLDQGLSWSYLPSVEDNFPALFNSYPTSLVVSPDQYLYLGCNSDGLKRTGIPSNSGVYLTGIVRSDADADCSTPDAQSPLHNWTVEAAGSIDWYATTDTNGRYLMFVDTGSYEVNVRSPHFLWWEVCDGSKNVFLNELLSTDTADFAVAATAECPLMTVDVAIPFLRRCFSNNAYVHYCNQGSETADSAWVDVELDPYLSIVSSMQPHENLGSNVFRFFLGNVESGECGQFSFAVLVDCDSTVLGQTHCITAHAFPDTLCTTVPDWSGAAIEAEVECQDTSIQLRLHNAGNAPSQTLDYIIIEDDVVLMNGDNQYDPGEELTIQFPANGHTWRIESEQEPGHPFSVQAVAFAEGCGGFESLGFINQFNVNTFQPSWDWFCTENTGSYDPNDKQGFPFGYDAGHRIRPGQELEYLIRFQNTGTDTAFNVVIRDTLSPWLDPASVRPGAASHPYTWELSGQGILKFTFSNILLPDSNTNLAASQGFVSFKIDQQPDVPLGTQIFNTAAIYFDFNLPVITNQTLHTVGADYLVGTHAPVIAGKQNRVFVSPNPMHEEAVFQLNNGVFNQHRLLVTDAYGRILNCPGHISLAMSPKNTEN
ncbi:MAG TPA: sialidase family protein, partial [Saprospiraceae bacterium]|nr:sialidase family protein [Saprospiraceae bacterium]